MRFHSFSQKFEPYVYVYFHMLCYRFDTISHTTYTMQGAAIPISQAFSEIRFEFLNTKFIYLPIFFNFGVKFAFLNIRGQMKYKNVFQSHLV